MANWQWLRVACAPTFQAGIAGETCQQEKSGKIV
jgi:hypothetical protein